MFNRILTVSALCLFVAGCGSSDDDASGNNHSAHQNHNQGADGVDTYVDGLMKAGAMGNYQVMLMSAEPAPPDVGDNTWTLRVMDSDGNPIDGAKVTVTPFMPAHGHGTSPADYTATSAGDGDYQVGPFDLFMPGTWETTIKVEGESEDMAVFSFKLEG